VDDVVGWRAVESIRPPFVEGDERITAVVSIGPVYQIPMLCRRAELNGVFNGAYRLHYVIRLVFEHRRLPNAEAIIIMQTDVQVL
jgi:hypothetical protein